MCMPTRTATAPAGAPACRCTLFAVPSGSGDVTARRKRRHVKRRRRACDHRSNRLAGRRPRGETDVLVAEGEPAANAVAPDRSSAGCRARSGARRARCRRRRRRIRRRRAPAPPPRSIWEKFDGASRAARSTPEVTRMPFSIGDIRKACFGVMDRPQQFPRRVRRVFAVIAALGGERHAVAELCPAGPMTMGQARPRDGGRGARHPRA